MLKVIPGVLFLFAIYLTFCVNQNYSDYSNEAGYCRNYNFYTFYYYIRCYITNNDTQSIKTLLSTGSQGNTSRFRLYVHKRYSSDSGYLTLDFNISSNIRYLHLDLSYSPNHEQITLKTSSINTKIEYMSCNLPVHLELGNFFNQFIGLTSIQFSDVVSTTLPSFFKLEKLRYLTAKLKFKGNQVLDSSFVSGLSKLQRLNLRDLGFTSITNGAFENMDSLSYLNLNHNKISSIQDGALRGLTYLRNLYLEGNGLRDVSNNVFRDLNQVTYLNLNENPGFPLSTIIKLQNLRYLYINFNNYQTIEPYVFQQMNSLTYIYTNNPFRCDCDLQWTSIVAQFGIRILGSYCLDPIDKFGRLITDKNSYTNCTQTESYQCFDSSVICESHLVCHNTNTSHYCGCPVGYEFNNIDHCSDIDECINNSNCQHYCVNTEGSFYCACNEGYKLSENGYDCEDINECQEGNGGCEFGCENTIGSYQCYCEAWQKLYDKTRCTNGIRCELVANNYDPLNCANMENVLNCKRGFNLSIINLPCTNVNVQVATTTMETNQSTQLTTVVIPQGSFESINPTLALTIVLFIGVGVQAIVIIVLIMFMVKMMRNQKSRARAPMNLELPPNPPLQETKYEFYNQSRGAENLKELTQEMGAIGNQMEVDSNATPLEPYPGDMDDGTVYMNVS